MFIVWEMGARGGCQGAPGLLHRSPFDLLGAPFSHSFLCTTICSNKSDLRQNMYPKYFKNLLKRYLHIAILSALFFCRFSGRSKVRTCVWAMPVQSKSLRAQITWHTKWVEKSSEKVHKYTKKAWLEHRLEKTWKKWRMSWKCVKDVSKMVSKRVSLFLYFPPWRLLGQLWRSNRFLDAQSAAKELPKWRWNNKSDSKRHSTDVKVCQKWCRIPKSWDSGTPNFIKQHDPRTWPGGLREALWIATRMRSLINPQDEEV